MRVELKEIDMKQLNKMYIGEEGKATSVVLPPTAIKTGADNSFCTIQFFYPTRRKTSPFRAGI
jgi:hypothetical protein